NATQAHRILSLGEGGAAPGMWLGCTTQARAARWDLAFNVGANRATVSADAPPERWRHLAICNDAATLTLFLDGKPLKALPSSSLVLPSTPENLRLGALVSSEPG